MDANAAADSSPTRRLSLDVPLLDADQIGRLLMVPRSSVYEYARRAHDPLPSIRIGRHVRFHRDDIEAWIERQRLGDRASDRVAGRM
jgi:excisionase family DNA binding protein